LKASLAAILAMIWLLTAAAIILSWATIPSDSILVQPLTAGALTAFAFLTHYFVFGLGLGSFTSMAMLSYAVFHLFEIIPVQLGWCSEQFTNASRPGFPFAILAYSLFVAGSEFGVCAGYLLFAREWTRPSKIVSRQDFDSTWVWKTGRVLGITGTLLLATGLYQFGFGSFWSSSYGETFQMQTEFDPRGFVMGMWALPAAALVMLCGAVTRNQYVWTAISTGLFFAFTTVLGYRGGGFTFLMAALVVLLKRRLIVKTRFVYVAAFLVIIFVLPIVKKTRSLPLTERFSLEALPAVESLWDGPREIGGTFRLLTYSMELLPARSEFWYGRTYAQALVHIVPNLNPNWSADFADLTRNMRIGEWMTFVLEPTTWRTYGGIGSSGIAEPYVNFGHAAIPIHFTLLFLLLGYLDWRCLRRPSSYTLAIGALLLMPVCWSARDDIYSVARSFTWGAAILWCGQKIGQREAATGSSRSKRESTGSLRPEANCGVGS
jgi:hypothetical protein